MALPAGVCCKRQPTLAGSTAPQVLWGSNSEPHNAPGAWAAGVAGVAGETGVEPEAMVCCWLAPAAAEAAAACDAWEGVYWPLAAAAAMDACWLAVAAAAAAAAAAESSRLREAAAGPRLSTCGAHRCELLRCLQVSGGQNSGSPGQGRRRKPRELGCGLPSALIMGRTQVQTNQVRVETC